MDTVTYPVKPAPAKGLKVKTLPPPRHRPTAQKIRPRWNSGVFATLGQTVKERIETKEFDVAIEQPDYVCLPASRYNVSRNDCTATLDGQVYLIKENYKPAEWCNPPRHTIRVRQHHKWGAGHDRFWTETLPNNYRLAYPDGSEEYRSSDYCRVIEPGSVYKTISPEEAAENGFCICKCRSDAGQHGHSQDTAMYFRIC